MIVELTTEEQSEINGGFGLVPLIFIAAVAYGYWDESTKHK